MDSSFLFIHPRIWNRKKYLRIRNTDNKKVKSLVSQKSMIVDPHKFDLLDPDPDPGRKKLLTKIEKIKEFSYFEVLDVLF
jgi:hypothetical protein